MLAAIFPPLLFLAACFAPAPAFDPGGPGVALLAQRKPYDRGNCFHWPGCRGESLGAMWVHAPDFCAALGGRSWLDEAGRCHDLTPGPRGLISDTNSH